jgi:hypothetical protein
MNMSTGDDNIGTNRTFGGALTGDGDFSVAVLLLLVSFSLATVVGNALVIAAVWKVRCLRTVTNYLVTSLATADLLVGALVMPVGAVVESMQGAWVLGQDWCDVWHSVDVLCSTASILNLCAISIDRYIAITDPLAYPLRMTGKVGVLLVLAVWFLSALISFPAIGWWRSVSRPIPDDDHHGPDGSALVIRAAAGPGYADNSRCLFTQDLGYLAFSSIISFYAPLLGMVFTYCRIYRSAVNTTRSLKLGRRYICRDEHGHGAATAAATAGQHASTSWGQSHAHARGRSISAAPGADAPISTTSTTDGKSHDRGTQQLLVQVSRHAVLGSATCHG